MGRHGTKMLIKILVNRRDEGNETKTYEPIPKYTMTHTQTHYSIGETLNGPENKMSNFVESAETGLTTDKTRGMKGKI
jgi:hypothetical protein